VNSREFLMMGDDDQYITKLVNNIYRGMLTELLKGINFQWMME